MLGHGVLAARLHPGLRDQCKTEKCYLGEARLCNEVESASTRCGHFCVGERSRIYEEPMRYREKEGGSAGALEPCISLPGPSFLLSLGPPPSQ